MEDDIFMCWILDASWHFIFFGFLFRFFVVGCILCTNLRFFCRTKKFLFSFFLFGVVFLLLCVV